MAAAPPTSSWQLRIDGRSIAEPDRQSLGRALEQTQHLLWLDITGPTDEDMALLQDAFDLHELALDDALKAGQRAKIESYPGHYFITFYHVAYGRNDRTLQLTPLHLFAAQRYLISIHPEPIARIDELLARPRRPFPDDEKRGGAGLYALLDAIVDDYFPILDAIGDEIADLEDHIFTRTAEEDREVFATVFTLKKKLLRLRRRVAPERDILNVLLRHEQPLFDTSDTAYLQDLYDHLVRLTESIDLYRDLLTSALESHLSYQSNRLNRVVEVLTVASIILMSCALIAGIYGMNFDVMPELHWTFGYLFALGLMAAISGGLITLFRHQGWL